MKLVHAVLVSQAALLAQLVPVAPELVTVLVKLHGVLVEGRAARVLAVHAQGLRQLVLVDRHGVVVGQVGLIGAVGHGERFLATVFREFGVYV